MTTSLQQHDTFLFGSKFGILKIYLLYPPRLKRRINWQGENIFENLVNCVQDESKTGYVLIFLEHEC